MNASRRAMFAVPLLVAAVTLTGCTSTHTPEHDAVTVAAEIQSTVAALPGVTGAKVWTTGYRDTASAETYGVRAEVTVADGTDTAPVADEIVKLVWLSPLQPGPQVSVTFFDGHGYLPGKTVDVSLDKRSLEAASKTLQADLTKKYGPRRIP